MSTILGDCFMGMKDTPGAVATTVCVYCMGDAPALGLGESGRPKASNPAALAPSPPRRSFNFAWLVLNRAEIAPRYLNRDLAAHELH